jgi:hypothetical protein
MKRSGCQALYSPMARHGQVQGSRAPLVVLARG